jgi:hypothetical protein
MEQNFGQKRCIGPLPKIKCVGCVRTSDVTIPFPGQRGPTSSVARARILANSPTKGLHIAVVTFFSNLSPTSSSRTMLRASLRHPIANGNSGNGVWPDHFSTSVRVANRSTIRATKVSSI